MSRSPTATMASDTAKTIPSQSRLAGEYSLSFFLERDTVSSYWPFESVSARIWMAMGRDIRGAPSRAPHAVSTGPSAIYDAAGADAKRAPPGAITVTDRSPWPRAWLADSFAVTNPRRSDPTPLAIVLP